MHSILAFFISAAVFAAQAQAPAPAPAPVQAPAPTPSPERLKITGETIDDAQVKNAKGDTVSLSGALQGKFSVVTFAKAENINAESAAGYFKSLVPYLKKLDYQIVVVTPSPIEKEIAKAIESHGQILIDTDHNAYKAMGLSPTNADSINAIYLVAPDRQIMFHYASVTDKIPFSGEVLLLAARVYRDAFREKQ